MKIVAEIASRAHHDGPKHVSVPVPQRAEFGKLRALIGIAGTPCLAGFRNDFCRHSPIVYGLPPPARNC